MTQQPGDPHRDWRRQQRGRGRPSTDPETAAANAEPDGETAAAAAASRTLFSFLEPSLNTVGIYGAPLVIAGIIALIAGGVLVAFVSSMRLYGFNRPRLRRSPDSAGRADFPQFRSRRFHQPHRPLRRQLPDYADCLPWHYHCRQLRLLR